MSFGCYSRRGAANNFEETKFTPGQTAAVQVIRFIVDGDLEAAERKDLVASEKVPVEPGP
jgi:hypothetical protein